LGLAELPLAPGLAVLIKYNMVREKVLPPSEADIPPQARPPAKQDKPEIGAFIKENNYGVPHSTTLTGGSLNMSNVPNSGQPPDQPEFGRPTALGSPLQPHRAPHPASQRNSNESTGHAGAASNQYSNLFISAKPTQRRPEHHKLPPQNPLLQAHQQIRKSPDVLPQPKTASTYDASSLRPGDIKLGAVPVRVPTNDDPMEIPRPISFPSVAARPPGPPTFSSHTTSNPYYASRNFVDLTTSAIGMATNESLYDGRFGTSDPYTYVDAAKANENIKQLLEGAFEDEDDKPRTRQRQKDQLKAGDLAENFKGMSVNGKEEDDNDEQDGEEDDGTVEGLKVKLLPHQIDGVAWMRDKELGKKKTRGVFPKGGILADDMGLGKTIQSIALMLTNPKPLDAVSEGPATGGDKEKRKLSLNVDGGTLVVAPLALIKQWEGEIKDRVEDTHTLRVCVHHGPQRAKSYKGLKKYDVVITTYHTLVSEHGSSEGKVKVGCFGLSWYRVILDEAHSIKNRNAKATKAACALNAEYRWCLTGTPMQNNLDELQSLIHFLRIKPYDDLDQWREGITRPMSNGRGGLAIRRLQVYLKAFMKRRTKDILKQDGALKYGDNAGKDLSKPNAFKIVKRTVEKIEADFTPEERAFYQRLEMRTDKSLEQMMAGNKVSYASALVLLLRLRQACNHPQLVKGDLAKERDAFTNDSGSQTTNRKKASNEDMDSVAEMLGGLSVATKRCDVCQIELSAKESSIGAIRCTDCEADLENENLKPKAKALQSKKEKSRLKENNRRDQSKRKPTNRRIIDDSDDENAEADSDGDDQGVKPRGRKPEDVVNLDEEDDSDSGSLVADSGEDVENGDDDEEDELSSEEDIAEGLIMSTKIRQLLSILKRDASKHKYIVFSFFTSMLDLIEPFLKQEGLVYTRYDGAMRNDLREASLERLRNNAKTRILLCSLRAGSLGLNLTAASRVVILEPFWNPFVEEQAIDRVHRLNQTQDVVVYKMTVKDTVEARILDLQDRKRELANATIEGKSAAAKLTLQDMLKLFRHDAEHLHGVDGIGLNKARLLGDDRHQSQEVSRSRREGSGGPAQPTKQKEHEVYGRRW
jgi:SNF2 family DNA or RNA helicase